VAALATLGIGFLWYSLLFARPSMVLMGYDPDDQPKLGEMQKGGQHALGGRAGKHHRDCDSEYRPLRNEGGLAVGWGFVTPVQLTNAVFSKQPAKLYAINTGYPPVCNLATP
jgi:hypothetical protein